MHIIGAGIGGLSLALALHRVGISSQVYEQAPELEPIGAGIGLWPGALSGLRTLGVADWFWEMPVCPFRWAETATPDGRTITGFDVSGITGGQGYVVRRSHLHRALLEQLPSGAVVTGKHLIGLAQDPAGVDLDFRRRQHAAGRHRGGCGRASIGRACGAVRGPAAQVQRRDRLPGYCTLRRR